VALPVEFLKRLKTFLKPSGLLICEVPNVDELLIKECPPYNDFYWIRAHLNYFGKKTLDNCFMQAGFDKREIRFEQRYGLLNLSNWLTTGMPQIDRPLFDIPEAYQPVENKYRAFLEEKGVSDAVIMIASVL
jgi:predicted SAM-dependent methyltransferase